MESVLDSPTLRHQATPLSVEAYHALGDLGMLEEKSELLQGFVFPKMPKSPRHRIICQKLLNALRAAASKGISVWQEQPISCGNSEPEPDISVVRGEETDFAKRHPVTAALVVEVSINSLDRDLKKAGIYAAAGVEEYWIIRPEENFADVYTLPEDGGYTCVRRVEKGGVLVPGILPAVSIPMDELME